MNADGAREPLMKFCAVSSPVAPLLGEPRISASLISQLLFGEVVSVLEPELEPAFEAVLDEPTDWLRVSGPDGYEGWTHRGYLMPSTGSENNWHWSLGCVITQANGQAVSLPLGARVSPQSKVESGTVISETERALRFSASGSAIASSARDLFLGASYLWGGVTPWGVDCSGLVQRSARLHGLNLPRDAWQQAEATELVCPEFRSHNQAGDLLFFSDRADRRVTHVGISLGDDLMIHSALKRGRVLVERLSSDDPYVQQLKLQCVGVRRCSAAVQ